MIDSSSRFSAIHEAGAKRHMGAWLRANQRAVEVLAGAKKLRPSDPDTKRAVSLIVLRVLDGVRADRGEYWDDATEKWAGGFDGV